MKIGKGPKRFGGPSKEFLARKGSQDQAKADAKASKLPDGGDINIFLDDERPCKGPWTLVRSPAKFLELITDERIAARVRRISLDWYLGAGIQNGEAVAADLAARLLDPAFMPNLEVIHFHSSDHDKALGMLRKVQESLGDRETYLDIGMPWDSK